MLHELIKALRPLIWSLFLAVLVGMLASVSSIGLMGLSAWLIASAALQPPLYTLSLAILGVRFCGIMRAVFRYLERYLTHSAGFTMFMNFRQSVLQRIISSLPFLRQTADGDAFDIIINAVDGIRDAFLRFFLPPLTATLVCICAAIWLGFFDLMLTMILLTAWLIFVVVMPIYVLHLYHSRHKQINETDYSLTQEVIEFYEGNNELLAYGYDDDRLQHSSRAIEVYQQEKNEVFALKNKIDTMSEIITSLLFIAVIIAVIHCVNYNGMNAVMAITVLLTLQAILEILMVIPSLAEQINEAQVQWHSLKPFLQERRKNAVIDEKSSSRCFRKKSGAVILQAVNLSFGYDKIIAGGLNFCLHKGKRTLLLGESGSGKSTLFYVLTRLIYPSTGEIYLNGIPYARLSEEAVRKHFAVSFQEHHLLDLSIRDNFKLLYPDIDDEKIMVSLRKVHLDEFVKRKSEGLDYKIGSGGINLSGGQRHRLQLAICTAYHKDIVLLDEPTAGLDIISAGDFLQQLFADTDSDEPTTYLVSSHDLSIVKYFDDVIIFDDGKFIEQGEIKTLLQNKNSYLFKLLTYDNLL